MWIGPTAACQQQKAFHSEMYNRKGAFPAMSHTNAFAVCTLRPANVLSSILIQILKMLAPSTLTLEMIITESETLK